MKRPMCILAAVWLAGLFLAGRWPEFGTVYVISVYFLLVILGLLILKKFPHYLENQIQEQWYLKLSVLLLLIPCLFVAGFRYAEYSLLQQTERELPWKQLEKNGESHVLVQGVVKEKQCNEQVELVLTDCVLIGYYEQENQPAGDCKVIVETEGKEWLPETFIGNKIRVYGSFSCYPKAGNPGQFDAHEYYTGQGLFASVKALRVMILDSGKSLFGHTMFLMKQHMRESLMTLYPEAKAGVLAAMILGDKDLLPEEVKELYQQNGISHILAISGLHISMLCMGLFGGLRKLGIPVKAAMTIAASFLLFYIGYTGASTSSLRAGVMCLVLFGAKLFRRSYDLLSSLSLAAIVVTFLRPMELTSAGFLLSFGAVLGVAGAQEVEYWIKQECDGKKPWWSALVFGGMIQCVTIPISLCFFYELSPYSILLNLIVIPLVSLIFGGGLFSMLIGMILPVAAKIPAGGTYLLLEFYEKLCEMAQRLPFSVVLAGRPKLWQLVIYYLMIFVVLKVFVARVEKCVREWETRENEQKIMGRTKRKTTSFNFLAVGILLALVVLFEPGTRRTELLFLDVSQGDCALIYTEEGMVILSDCGSSDVSKVGEYRLSPVLKQNGTMLIDMAVVSHLDSDHTSGIKELLVNMTVYQDGLAYVAGYKGEIGIRELVLPRVQEKSEAYLELEALAKEKNVAVRYAQAGDVLYQEDKLLIECLYPYNARESEMILRWYSYYRLPR